nr:RNA polymerase alpha chain [Jacquemontia paniculata]
MIREKVTVSTEATQWICVESRTFNKRLDFGRFMLSPLRKGQADIIGIAMRRALLGEIEESRITRVKSKLAQHEYSNLPGIQESAHEILMNLKEIVFRSNLYGICEASICVKGPRRVTAKDIILPSYMEIVDPTQHIAWVTSPMDLRIGLQIERDRGYRKTHHNFEDGSFLINAVFKPVKIATFNTFAYGENRDEVLSLEIWTNGSLTPKEALREAARNLIDLFITFLEPEDPSIRFKLKDDDESMNRLSPFFFYDQLIKLRKKKGPLAAWDWTFIDQLEFSPKIYNCLKKSNISTVSDLFRHEDLRKIEHLDIEDVKQILGILEKRGLSSTSYEEYLDFIERWKKFNGSVDLDF